MGWEQRAKEMGVVNLLALRGGEWTWRGVVLWVELMGFCCGVDPPRGEEYWVAANEQFQHATDLVRYIREHHGNTFCIGVAGTRFWGPGERACEAGADGRSRRIPRGTCGFGQQARGRRVPLREAGSWRRLCCHAALLRRRRLHGVVPRVSGSRCDFWRFLVAESDELMMDAGITIPILPGIMPIQNYQSFRRMTNLCKSSIPAHITADLERIEVRSSGSCRRTTKRTC